MEKNDLMVGIEPFTLNPTRKEFYTNYPPFKYWTAESNNAFLEQSALNIYIHIPFCSQTCAFCYYKKDLVKSYDEVRDYMRHLKKEIELTGKNFDFRSRPVGSIYIGGGTPSLLKDKDFIELMETLRRYHSIDKPEISVEVDPGSASRQKINTYTEAGVNRISMGVQSFDDRVIKLSHRNHTADKAIRAANMIKEKDPNICVNIDLLSGLAGDTVQTFSKSVDTAIALQLEMVTVYKMITYSNTFFFEKGVRKGEMGLPSSEEEIEFFNVALDKMEEANYHLLTSYSFTKSKYHHSYIENTFRGQDLVAYGTSAFGKLNNLHYQNTNSMDIYKEKIGEGKLPVYRTYRLTAKDLMTRELLLASKLSSYSRNEFVRKFGFDYYTLIPEVIGTLSEEGFITVDDSGHRLTRKGVIYGDFVSKTLASAFRKKLGADNIGFDY